MIDLTKVMLPEPTEKFTRNGWITERTTRNKTTEFQVSQIWWLLDTSDDPDPYFIFRYKSRYYIRRCQNRGFSDEDNDLVSGPYVTLRGAKLGYKFHLLSEKK